MSAAQILQILAAAGIELHLSDDGKLTAPVGSLTEAMREAIKAHRAEIIFQMAQAKRLTQQLIHEAMRVCDFWQDDETRRAEMQKQCREAKPAEQIELLRYFQQTYGGTKNE